MESASDSNANGQRARTPTTKRAPKAQRGGDKTSSATSVAQANKAADNVNRQRAKPATSSALASDPINTPAKPAYAGPSFQASPAPSSLPVPRFFSRSVPVGGLAGGAGGQDQRQTQPPQNTPPQANTSPYQNPSNSRVPVKESSALDVLFNAARQERAGLQSGGSLAAATQTPFRSQTPDVSRQLFAMELDDAESPAARRAEKTAPLSQQQQWQQQPGPNPIPYPGHRGDFGTTYESSQATNDLKALLGLGGSATPHNTNDSTQPFDGRLPPSDRSTPSQGRSDGLLYGDRNLSPMFQAARVPTPHAQQQYPHGHGQFQSYSPYQQQVATPPQHSSQPQQPRINGAGPIPFPTQQLKQAQFQHPMPLPHQQMPHQSPPPFASNLAVNGGQPMPSQQQQSTLAPKDVQDMESNLRKMLNLA